MVPCLEIVNFDHAHEHEQPLDDPLTNEESENSADLQDDDWQNVTKPGDHDVLLGRGGGTNNHSGNVRFRKLVNEHKMRYLACSKVDKPKVAREVVHLWRKMEPPGRFLTRKDESRKGPGSVKAADNIWFEVGDKKAREKASQCLRERTADVLPYIKQLREQQDAITEQGVSMVQQQLQMQSENADYFLPQHAPSFQGRRTSMPGPPEHPVSPRMMMMNHRRTSAPAHHVAPLPQPFQHARRSSLPSAPRMYEVHGFPEEEYEISEIEYQRKMMMMQQQLQMQHMELHRLQQQRAMQRAGMSNDMGSGYAHRNGGGPVVSGFDPQQLPRQQQEQLYSYDDAMARQHDPLLSMPAQPITSVPQTSPAPQVTPDQDQRRGAPKRTHSTAQRGIGGRPNVACAPDFVKSNLNQTIPQSNAHAEDGELTLEEYRQQLEEYIANSQVQQNNEVPCGNDGGGESDLEDDWEKEKEKAYKQRWEPKRGVNRNVSGCSFMSYKTTKSNGNTSMVSGLSGLTELLKHDEENRCRSISSNISLMSELTDLSQNIDNLSLYDD